MSALTGARAATVADLDAIMALERASFPADAWSAAMMREELASPHGWYVVVVEGGRVIGYAGLRAPRGGADADIQTITIESGARGRGRGRALLTTLLDEAVRRGVRNVFLEVRADNPVAQRLYASEGFAEVGRRPRYYQPDGVDAIVMKLDLRGWAARPRAGREQDILRAQGDSARQGPVLAGTPVRENTDAADAGACT
jgi:[ribosomal protein S18]-alanine N-acetyltransferase